MCVAVLKEGENGKNWFVDVVLCNGNPARRNVMLGWRASEESALADATDLIKKHDCEVSRVEITRWHPPKERTLFG
jgi:hypothetical protein